MRIGREPPQSIDLLCSGASVAVLPLDMGRGEIILLRQFRLAAHLANGRGALFEIVAGHVEKGEHAAETARRECAEEIGRAPSPLIELFTYLTTPGLCDEQITVFLGIIDVSQIPERAGLAAEHEETFLVRVPIDRALAAAAAGSLRSGPLLMALNWLALNRGRLERDRAHRHGAALMGAILLAIAGMNPQPWQERFGALAPHREVRTWSGPAGAEFAAVRDPGDIAYACVWLPPPGLLATLPNLRAIFSLGAGVDHILCDPALPEGVPVVRIVDPDLTMRMTEYVVLHVLMHHRGQRRYDAQQRAHRWFEHEQRPAAEVAVGVMGLGVLGQDAAQVLRRLGFQVAGWSRTHEAHRRHRNLSWRRWPRAVSAADGNSRMSVAGDR